MDYLHLHIGFRWSVEIGEHHPFDHDLIHNRIVVIIKEWVIVRLHFFTEDRLCHVHFEDIVATVAPLRDIVKTQEWAHLRQVHRVDGCVARVTSNHPDGL